MGNLYSILRFWEEEPYDDDSESEDVILSNIVEQYAAQVLDFSSQYGSDRSFSYTAANCLGLPSKFPSYGDFPQTFVFRTFGNFWEKAPGGRIIRELRNPLTSGCPEDYLEFIDLKFEHKVYVHATYVYETLNPGSVVAIWGGDCKGSWKCLWKSQNPAFAGHRPRQFCPPLQVANFKINVLRIQFDSSYLPYYSAVDAVCLLGTIEPFTNEAKMNSILPPTEQRSPLLRQIIDKKLHLFENSVLDTDQSSITELQRLSADNDDIPEEDRPALSDGLEKAGASNNGPFDQLPYSHILHIFRYLDLQGLVRCRQVCHLFNDVAADPLLYVRLNLRPLFHCVSNDTFKYLFDKSHYTQYLDLSTCGNYGKLSPTVLKTFFYTRGSRLQHLLLANCHVATSEVVDMVGRFCLNLVDLNMSNCHILDTGSFKVLGRLQDLQHVNFYRTQIGQFELNTIIQANRGLRCLNIASCSLIDGDDTCLLLERSCPQLEVLDLWRCLTLTARGVMALSRMPNLTDLDIGWCSNVNPGSGCIRNLTAGCTKLERIILSAQRQLTDQDIQAVAQLKNLRQLNIMGTRNISPGAIFQLASNCPELELLDIGYCDLLETQDFLRDLHNALPNCHIVSSFNNN